MGRTIKIVITIFWVVMTSWYFIRGQSGSTAMAGGGQDMLRDLGPEQGQEWFGIYLTGKNDNKMKIGFSVSESQKRTNGYVISGKSWMRMKILGEIKTIRTDSKMLTDLQYRLININFVFSSDTIKFEVLGDVDGNKLNLLIKTGAGDQKQTIELTEPPILPETIMAGAVLEGLEVGKTFSMPFFDPTTFGYSTAEVRVVEMKPGDKGKTFWKMVSSYKGLETEAWIDEEGKVQWQKAANFISIRETKKEALNEGWDNKNMKEDILDQTKVKVAKPIKNSRTASKVTLRLSGADLAGFLLDGGRQSFDKETGQVTITKENVDPSLSYMVPTDEAKFAEELKSTPMIQTEDAMIVTQRREIIGQQTDALKLARLNFDWVYQNLEKKPLVSIPSARDVLEIMRGDCNEHATLFAALARSSKVPTKIVVGLVYQDNAFYYHAWNAVWIGQWVEVDSTFGQFPADATHIRMLEGGLDKQIELLRVFGKLQIEVISAQ